MKAAGGRAAVVCEACRIRHRKCDFEDRICKQCLDNGIDCIRQPGVKFRYDPRQRLLAAESPGTQQRLTRNHPSVEFFDETPGLLYFYTGYDAQQIVTSQTPQYDEASSTHLVGLPTPDAFPPYLSPAGDQTSSELAAGYSPGQWTSAHPFSESEARLVRNFAENMALWTDITDPVRSFEFEVPRRALTEPLLRHAICAFSARHLHRAEGRTGGEEEALDHQNKCLELLIPAMSGGQFISVSTLTAVAVMRQNEEMDEHDHRFHLEGASRIFNMAPQFATVGGLGEAAAWLCLREDIYVSLTTQSPMNIRTDSFYRSATILQDSDFSRTQRMVVGLAVLLKRAFTSPLDQADILASETEITEWHRSKPASFEAIYYRPRSLKDNRCYPEIWMLSPHHAVGLQYFHIAQIVLLTLKGGTAGKPYEHLADSRIREREIRQHLSTVVGIAISNPRAENTWFTARHCLSVWSGCLHRAKDRQAALTFLADMEARTGWRTKALVEGMQRSWAEDSDDE